MLSFFNRISKFSIAEDVTGSYLAPLLGAMGGRNYTYYPSISEQQGVKGKWILEDLTDHFLATVCKVLSYVTIILPVIALTIQLLSRCIYAQELAQIPISSTLSHIIELPFAEGQELSYLDSKPAGEEVSHIGDESVRYPAPRPIEFGERNQELIEQFLRERPKDDEARRILQKGFNAIEFLTFANLQTGFNLCLNEFLKQLGERKVTVAENPKKSSEWMLQMAIEQGAEKSFTQLTTYQSDTSAHHWIGHKLQSSNGEVVLFDDAAYSGSQITEALSSLQRYCKVVKRTAHLTIVIPFISQRTLQRIQNNAKSSPLVQVTLITTDRRLPGVTEVFTKEEIDYLYKGNPQNIDYLSSTGLGLRRDFESTCLATTQWKRPDTTSFPSLFSRWGRNFDINSYCFSRVDYFFGNPVPPYRLVRAAD